MKNATISIEKAEVDGVVFHNIKINLEISDTRPGEWRSGSNTDLPNNPKPESPVKTVAKLRGGLDEALEKTGLNNSEIAELLGVSNWTVRAWCLGYYRPIPRTLEKLAQLLNTDSSSVLKLFPRGRRRKAYVPTISTKKVRKNYKVISITENRFAAINEKERVEFTTRKQGNRVVIAEITEGNATELARKVARDGKITGFGRVCHAARLNAVRAR